MHRVCANWVQTWPGKGWNTILRLYGPLQPWLDKTWRPGEIEEIQGAFRRFGAGNQKGKIVFTIERAYPAF